MSFNKLTGNKCLICILQGNEVRNGLQVTHQPQQLKVFHNNRFFASILMRLPDIKCDLKSSRTEPLILDHRQTDRCIRDTVQATSSSCIIHGFRWKCCWETWTSDAQ